MTEMLRIDNINFSYGSNLVLQGWSGRVAQGERVGLLGPSGCGKTSLLRLIAGLEKPQSGQIHLRGQLVSSPTIFVPANKRNVGYVFQNSALFEKVSVKKNIYYGCKNNRQYEKADELVKLLGLESFLDKKPTQLSGGEKQKVALARSLAIEPDLILLDEPFASIDQSQTDFLISEFVQLFDSLKITAIMVTHSAKECEAFSKRVIRLPAK